MIEIKNKQNCCGCGGCMNVCPKGCIKMTEDFEGFLYPEVDTECCINCGLCEKVCPVINHVPRNENSLQKAFVVQHKNKDVLQQSTSGGAFTAIAHYIIEHGGVVFGVELDENNNVRHIYVEREEDLRKFRNSKYVQSNIGEAYKQAKKFLSDGRMVCFSGTPCQIEGFRHYLRKDYENLILVDVVCRAVPSPGIWKKYVEMETEEHGKLTNIRFRDKAWGYQYSTMVIEDSSNHQYRGGVESQPWLRMFFSGMIIRPSCSECKFKSQYRYSDFTIWDCYNIHDIDKAFDESAGTTRVLIHSKKGLLLFDQIKHEVRFKEIDVDRAVNGVYELYSSHDLNPLRDEFYHYVNNKSLKEAINKYFPNTYKVKTKKLIRKVLYKTGFYSFAKRMIYRMVKRRKYR